MSYDISDSLKTHYTNKFKQFGATSEGIDWGEDNSKVLLRYGKMANLLEGAKEGSLLDVGCGFGGFFEYLKGNDFNLDYTGIDIADNMIYWAKEHHEDVATFICDDFLEYEFNEMYDFVVCNGVLTQKLQASNIQMDDYAKQVIKKMFALSKKGIAFNIMTTKVNFFSNNLYYRNPAEMFAYCLSELSAKIKIDHSYLYEYTMYVYRD